MKFDMHALLGMTVEFSDDEGSTWQNGQLATSIYSVQDHQTMDQLCYQRPVCHDLVFLREWGPPHPLCSTSFDGGRTWTSEVSGAPVSCPGGLTAYRGRSEQSLYRSNIGCNGDGYSIYRAVTEG